MIKFNSLADQKPSGAVRFGEKIQISCKVSREKYNHSVFLVLLKDGEFFVYHRMEFESVDGGYNIYSVVLDKLEVGLYFYHFELQNSDGCQKYFADDNRNTKREYGTYFQLSVYEKSYKTPSWFKGGVMYHIFVDRFFEYKQDYKRSDVFYHTDKNDIPHFLPNENGKILNNDFYGGTLYGIAKKLDYIKSLGVTVLYLSPIFKAYSSHKYDTGDYMQIDEGFGGEKAYEHLTAKAKKLGIRIILDGVFNHTGDDSRYFNKYGSYDEVGAYNSKDSKYYDWYLFHNYPNKYESWWGIDVLPTINKNSSFIEFIAGDNGVIEKYTNATSGGFRLDVVDELPQHFVERIRKTLKHKNKDAMLIGEVWEDASNKIAYSARRRYFLGKELDSVMNYPLKDAIIASLKYGNFHILEKVVLTQLENYPKQTRDVLMNILSTHDTKRILTALTCKSDPKTRIEQAKIQLTLDEQTRGIALVKLASFLQYFLYGVPCVYYGDEIAMSGFSDPFCREYFKWDRVGNELNLWYKKLGEIRANLKILKTGEFKVLYASKTVFIFERYNKRTSVIFAVNIGDKVEFVLDKSRKSLFSNATTDKLELCANSVEILK